MSDLALPDAASRAYGMFKALSGHVGLVLIRTTALRETALGVRGRGLAHLLRGICSTSAGILKVADHPAFIEEGMMLARVLVERQINAAFLAVCDQDHYEGYEMHAFQRHYRNLDREAGPSGLRVRLARDGIPEPSSVPGLAEALARFTSKNNRPKNWTDVSLDARIGMIAERAPDCRPVTFVLAQVGIYGRASEAIHGSLFGLTAFHGEKDGSALAMGEQNWEHAAGEMTAMYVGLSHTTASLLKVIRQASSSPTVDGVVAQALTHLHTDFAQHREATASNEETRGGEG